MAQAVAIIITYMKTSLLRMLQAEALLDETIPIGKIHPFSKVLVTFKLMMLFDILYPVLETRISILLRPFVCDAHGTPPGF